jgi:hypothetical protein
MDDTSDNRLDVQTTQMPENPDKINFLFTVLYVMHFLLNTADDRLRLAKIGLAIKHWPELQLS